MTKFIISEQQDANSYRAGVEIEAKSLKSAKVAATKAQLFQRTCLKIESADGDVLAFRDEAGKWKTFNAV